MLNGFVILENPEIRENSETDIIKPGKVSEHVKISDE
jgi:hypothetical protein